MIARWRLVVLLSGLAGACAEPADTPLPLGSDSASCGTCHEDHYEQWRDSPHGTSPSSPIFVALLPEVEAAWGALARETCEGCHTPRHSDEDAISCVSCHAATGNHAERDGMLAVDLAAPMAGPFGDAEPTVAHASRQYGFLTSPSLCGTCHEITEPALVDEPTLTEYRASPQAAAGRTCADCHLPSDGEERAISNDSTTPRRVRSHRFVGFDPPWGADADERAAAAERTRALLSEALSLRLEPVDAGVEVIVENVGAGHSVPTGATWLRDLWVDVSVEDPGSPAESPVTYARVLSLGDRPMRGDEPVALLTDADRVEHGSLAAGASRRIFVALEGGTVTARLRGRAIRSAVLTELALTERADEVPTHEIAEATVTLPAP